MPFILNSSILSGISIYFDKEWISLDSTYNKYDSYINIFQFTLYFNRVFFYLLLLSQHISKKLNINYIGL
jgi:hypothetical protein